MFVNWQKILSTKTSHIYPTHPTNSELYIIRVFMYLELKIWYFKNILKAYELVGWKPPLSFAHVSRSCNNPWNVFTLILYSFIGSLWNIRFCQIRLVYPTLYFWSKFKNVFKKVKFGPKISNIKRLGFFFQHPLVDFYI